jgi:hypothetical protein
MAESEFTGQEQPQDDREARLAEMRQLADQIAASAPEEPVEADPNVISLDEPTTDAERSAVWAAEQAVKRAVAEQGDYPSADEYLAQVEADRE